MKLTVKTLLFISVIFISEIGSAKNDFLRTEGTRIVNPQGENVILRGAGLGGWMLQEGYMLQTSGFADTQYKIKEHMTDLIGEEGMEAFYDAWLLNYCTRADVDSMAALGFNSIRLPMHYNLFTLPIEDEPVAGQDTWLNRGFEMVDELLEWCETNQMYLILDLHAAPGGQGKNASISDYNPNKPSLWESEENQRKTIALWQKIAERYANEPWIGGYDLINEPNWDFEDSGNENGCNCEKNEPLWALFEQMIKAIREVDRNHIIFLAGNCWGNNYKGLPDFTQWDNNIVISFHKYWNFNNQESIQWAIDMREKYKAPIWLGESGENSNVWFSNAISLLESNNIGWAWWPYKKIESSTGRITVPKTVGYQNILDYLRGKAAKPSAYVAKQWLMEQAEMLKLENCVVNYDVLDAMFRQAQGDKNPVPFRTHILPGLVFASDYDLGANNFAYFDTDTANYRTSTQQNTRWNKGGKYRNDGVDIFSCADIVSNGFYVGNTENGEWLNYTVEITENGFYELNIRYATNSDNAKIRIQVGENYISEIQNLPSTGKMDNWATFSINGIQFNKGKSQLKLLVENGGFNINYLEFKKTLMR
jgi:aryl-phospho-beta-D-glucosidase BglC (GH1 family)